MFNSLDISASALVAQRARMNVISNNIANISTTRNEEGEQVPFQARHVVFEANAEVGGGGAGMGVRVSSVETDDRAPRLKYQPGHPDARPDGYVAYPDINLMEQMVDSIEASRAYEANLGVIEVSKNMAQRTLDILA